MKLNSEKLKCPLCGSDPMIEIKKSCIRFDNEYEKEEDRRVCTTHDNIFVKLTCSNIKCNHTYRAMITLNIEPVSLYITNEDSNSKLVMERSKGVNL